MPDLAELRNAVLTANRNQRAEIIRVTGMKPDQLARRVSPGLARWVRRELIRIVGLGEAEATQ